MPRGRACCSRAVAVRAGLSSDAGTSTPPQLQQDYEQATAAPRWWTAPSAASSRSPAAAASFLHGQVTNDIESLRPGDGCYAAFLTPKGKMLGDLRVLAVAGDAAIGAGGASVLGHRRRVGGGVG